MFVQVSPRSEIYFEASHSTNVPPLDPPRMNCPRILFRIVPAWSLKNKEVFRMGGVDFPRVLFRIVPAWSLKIEEVFRIGRVDCPYVLIQSVPA